MSIFRVFRSRWHALIWAGGMLWFAYDVASAQPQGEDTSVTAVDATDVTGTPINDSDAGKLLNAW